MRPESGGIWGTFPKQQLAPLTGYPRGSLFVRTILSDAIVRLFARGTTTSIGINRLDENQGWVALPSVHLKT